MSDTHIVIMAGGVGSRLYPLSTPEKPKQFLDLLGTGKTLIQMTVERFREVDPAAPVWVVTSKNYLPLVREQLPSIPPERILLEPVSRNTAPCIAYVSRKIALRFPSAKVVVTPSDAYVPDHKSFAKTIKAALDFLSKRPDAIVTLGIAPDRPDTLYGYIKADRSAGLCPNRVVPVEAFKEKPSEEVAKRYLSEGGYFWNAGIFVFGVQFMLSQLHSFAPAITSIMDELAPSLYTPGEQAALEELFPKCEKISIDYAVMEKSRNVFVVPSEWEWSDLGSFAAIEKITSRSVRP